MGGLPFCQVGDFGVFLIILLALNLCYGNHVRVDDDVHGFINSADCTPVGVTFSDASSSGLLLNMELKSRSGSLMSLVVAENFEKDDSSSKCPGQNVQDVLAMISRTLGNVKQEASTVIMETIPPLVKKKFLSRKLQSWPSDHSFVPAFPPIPVIQDPSPKQAPIGVSSPEPLLPPPPAPSPVSHTYNPLPPPRYSQRLVPSTAPAPMAVEPPTYKKLIPVPASPPMAHKKPTITSPPMHSPGHVIVQKPNPSPPVPAFKKKSAPPPHSPVPVQQPKPPQSPPHHITPAPPPSSNPVKPDPQKPSIPPVPTSHKQAPAPLKSQNPGVLHPPAISPVHNSAPSPLPMEPPTRPTPPRKQFYPIPKAPPIPQLPPVPTVPRRYFNFPKYGPQPSSPPS